MADVDQGSYSYSKERESLYDQHTDMTSVHQEHERTYWDAHQTRYSSRTRDLLKQQHPDTAIWSSHQTRSAKGHNKTNAGIEHMRIKICDASIVMAGLCPPIEHPTWVAALHAGGPCHLSGRCARCAGDSV